MSLGYIAVLKEQEVTYQPLMLVDILMNDGSTTLSVASHALNCGDGGFPYQGNNYLPRLLNSDDIMSQALSQDGIDQPPSFNIKLSDPDQFLWANYELPIGFKGATITCTFIQWEVGTQSYSTDSLIIFKGKCSASKPGDTTLTIPVNSKINLTQTQLPLIHIQSTCAWTFPSNAAQRQEGCNPQNDYSVYYNCGYAPDGGANAVGNWAEKTTLTSNIGPNDTSIPVASAAIPTNGSPNTAFITGVGVPAYIDQECVQILDYDSTANVYYVQRAQGGTDAASHASGATIGMPFTTCNLTRANCIQRLGNSSNTQYSPDGNIMADLAGRPSGRGSMIQYTPPAMTQSRGYITSKFTEIVNNNNEAKYGDAVPLVYGDPCWVDPKIVVTQGDANFTWFQVVLCSGQIDYVYDVVVNGERIPHGTESLLANVPRETFSATTGNWTTINDGRRNGSYTIEPPFNGSSQDCYGGLAVLLIQVPIAVATATSVPKITVRIGGTLIRVYTNPTTWTRQASSNPTWVIMDIFHRSGITPDEINIASAIVTAAAQDVQIAYKNILNLVVNTLPNERAGGATTRPYTRFGVSLSISSRRSAADVIRGLRSGSNLIILPNFSDGTFYFVFKSTLADQQPALATLNGQTASNATQPWISPTPEGTVGYGYPAYCFDETNIARKKNSPEISFSLDQTVNSATTNVYTLNFQNAENKGSIDSATVVDIEDISRVGVPITGSFNADGPNTFDRIYRVGRLKLAEGMRGNPRFAADGEAIGDTGGTLLATWETSMKAIHVNNGDLVSISDQKKGIENWLFRVTSRNFQQNGQRFRFTASYHNDIWYFIQFGQDDAPLFTTPWALANTRNPLVWNPATDFPVTGDSLFDPTDGSFGLSQSYQTAKDGSAIASLTATGYLPANQYGSNNPPMIATQGSTANTGGTIPGGFNMFFAICAKSEPGSSYVLSAPSYVALLSIPAGSNTNTATFSIPKWAPASAGYVAFAGRTINKMTYQTSADESPSSITLTEFNEGEWGIPDVMFDHVQFDVRRVAYAGVWWAYVQAATTTTITVQGAGFSTNQWASYDLSLVAKNGTNGADTKIVNMRVASNTTNVLTVESTSPAPSVYISPLDVIVCRSLPTFSVDSLGNGVVSDAGFINALNPLEPAISVIGATVVSGLITIQTITPHGYSTGGSVNITDINGIPAANGTFVITVVSATQFSLNGVTGSGTWTSGGNASLVAQGLQSVVGKIFRVFAGSGRGLTMRIAANTPTSFTVDGPFTDTLDSTTRYWIEESAPDNTFDTASIVNRIPEATVTQQMNTQNYNEQFLSVIGYAIDAGGITSNQGQSPVRDIFLLGSVAYTQDGDVPPAPAGTFTFGGGFVTVGFLSFATLNNTYSISLITMEVFSYNLALGLPTIALSANAASTDGTITVSGGTSLNLYVGVIIQIDEELMSVVAVGSGYTSATVARGALSSTAASHSSGALVYPLTNDSFTKTYIPGFFADSLKVTNTVWTESLPNRRVAAVEMVATNALGDGEAGVTCYSTYYGGQLTNAMTNAKVTCAVQVPGTLSILSNAASAKMNFSIPNPAQWALDGGAIYATLVYYSVGAAVTVNLNIPGVASPWATISLPAGVQYWALLGTDLSALAAVPDGCTLSIDVTSVGTTTPGAGLQVYVTGM